MTSSLGHVKIDSRHRFNLKPFEAGAELIDLYEGKDGAPLCHGKSKGQTMRFKITALLIILLWVVSTSLWASPRKITFSYNIDPNPPYVTGAGQNINWKKPGITLEVLKLMGERLGVQIVFMALPDRRSFLMASQGEVDGSFHWSFSPGRSKTVHYPMTDGKIDPGKRLMTQTYVLYKLKNSPLEWDGTRFHNIKGQIGANLGSSIVRKLQASRVDVHQGVLTGQLIQMLMLRRLEGVVTIMSLGDCAVKMCAEGQEKIVKVSPPLGKKNYYLVLSKPFVKKYPCFTKEIWNWIAHIRVSGKYRKIADRYAE